MSNFWADTDREIKRLLLIDNPKANEAGDRINYIECPECGKPEGYVHTNHPRAIVCHRMNKCSVTTLTRDLYPHLFTNFEERFKPTKENPHATAEAFLQARGLDTSRFEFTQGAVTEEGRRYQTVCIAFAGLEFNRLIDYKGSNKGRLGKYKGKHFATKSVQGANKVYVVEGIFDALALEQSGLASTAILSSMHNPEACFKEGLSYVLALDNDKAGIKGVNKLKAYLEQKNITFSVALPPEGKDWNDLLLKGDLGKNKLSNTLELCRWHGSLAMASHALDYFKKYSEKKPYSNHIFEFDGQTYKGIFQVDKSNQPEKHKAVRMMDCTLSIAYSIEDASLQYESRIYHIVNADSKREGMNTFRVKGADFSALNDFKAKLLQYRLLFFGGGYDLTLLAEYLFRKKPIKVRECQALGYDPISGCYVFTKFLYDKKGKHYKVDNDGYFHHHRLKPFAGQDKSIAAIKQVDTGKFIADLYHAYGDKGLLALGFWVSTTFSHVIFDEFGFFPFMSLHGDPHCGKSDLTTILNRCFYIDSEGLPMSSGNTKKGELRAISQKSSMVTAMLEGRKDNSRFDYDSILPLYNRNSLQVRAQTTNDNQVHDLKFNGALAFVQNNEQFVSKPAKERVVSIYFSEDQLDDTYEAWKHLKTYSPEQLAGIGHFVISNRAYFQENIIKAVSKTAGYFRSQGVSVDRIAKNHAVAYAGIAVLIELTKPVMKDDLLKYTLSQSMGKIETSRSELVIADYFMQCIDGFEELQGVHRDSNQIIIHMPTAIKATDDAWNKGELFEQMKLMDGFLCIKSSRLIDKHKTKECWHFRHKKPT